MSFAVGPGLKRIVVVSLCLWYFWEEICVGSNVEVVQPYKMEKYVE